MGIYFGDGRAQALVTLMSAVCSLYAASRVASLALAREDGSDPGRRAIAQWIPIAGVALTALFFGRADIILSIIFSTSVGYLMLVLGITCWQSPLQALPPSRNVWPLLFPIALFVLMAGISGHLSWWHALMMMGMGGAILSVWLQSSIARIPPVSSPPPLRRSIVLAGAIAGLTLIGSILAVRGTLAACSIPNSTSRMVDPGTFAAAILSPLLIVPTLGTASDIAQRGQPGSAITALIGTVFLNLCLLLPVAVLIWYFDPSQWNRHVTKFFNIRWSRYHWLPFDLPAWQIETVTLVVIGFAMVPVAIGRWTIGRLESSILILAYGGYIVMLVVFGIIQM